MKSMQWVPVPNKHDGYGYTSLVSHENGAAYLGIWLAILQLASKSKLRGALLRDEKTPHDAASICQITRLPTGLITETLTQLTSETIGWIEKLDIIEEPENLIEAITSLTGSCKTTSEEGKGMEGNGREGNGREPGGIAAVHQGVINKWNEIAKREGLKPVKVLGNKRYKHYRARIKTFPDFWEVIDREARVLGQFARGVNDRGWVLGFDYCIESENKFIKFMEGNFRERDQPRPKPKGPKLTEMRPGDLQKAAKANG